MFIAFVHTITLLVTRSFLQGSIVRRFKAMPLYMSIFAPVSYGAPALIAKLTPVHFSPGIIFFGRSLVLSLAGLFGGPLPAFIAVIIGTAFCLCPGGAGMIMGVLVIGESAALGTLMFYFPKKHPHILNSVSLYILGLLVHVIMVGVMCTLPHGNMQLLLKEIVPPVFVIFPFAFVVITEIYREIESKIHVEGELKRSDHKNRLILERSAVGFALVNEAGVVCFVNERFSAMLGHQKEEVV